MESIQSIQPQVYIALGVIIASIITGFFSFINLINAKDQKISEFRQDWINELRKDISKYCTQATVLALKISIFLQEEKKNINDFLNDHRSEQSDLFNCRNLIHLRLNPEDDIQIINQVNEIYKNFSEGNFDKNNVFQKCDNLIEISQKLLKKEWKRVKRGEWTHFITKWGTLFVFLSIAIYAYVFISALFNNA